MKAFDTAITESNGVLAGPWRKPAQMLHAQTYDSHASIHDDATAQKLGFQGGTIEGPTHFSQFAPLCERIWGKQWFETGCLSAHYRNPVFEGEEVQATIEMPKPGQNICAIGMTRKDGTEILRGTASVGRDGSDTALSLRLKELKPLTDPVILKDIKVGMKTDAADGEDGFRPAYGRPLSVLACREAEGHHRAVAMVCAAPTIRGAGRSCRSRC